MWHNITLFVRVACETTSPQDWMSLCPYRTCHNFYIFRNHNYHWRICIVITPDTCTTHACHNCQRSTLHFYSLINFLFITLTRRTNIPSPIAYRYLWKIKTRPNGNDFTRLPSTSYDHAVHRMKIWNLCWYQFFVRMYQRFTILLRPRKHESPRYFTVLFCPENVRDVTLTKIWKSPASTKATPKVHRDSFQFSWPTIQFSPWWVFIITNRYLSIQRSTQRGYQECFMNYII